MAFYDKGEMGRQAAKYGFQRDVFEKVYRLKETLAFLKSYCFVHYLGRNNCIKF